MEDNKIIRAFCPSKPIMRESAEDSRTIAGYAIVFGKPSVDMGYDEEFYEYIDKNSITLHDDIKATLFHNREKLIARCQNGSGTLKLAIDDNGLAFEFDAPHTPDGDTALELVKRGDLAGCSFTGYVTDYTDKVEGDKVTRHIKSVLVTEITIGSDPAYKDTSVTAREVETSPKKGSNDKDILASYILRDNHINKVFE